MVGYQAVAVALNFDAEGVQVAGCTATRGCGSTIVTLL